MPYEEPSNDHPWASDREGGTVPADSALERGLDVARWVVTAVVVAVVAVSATVVVARLDRPTGAGTSASAEAAPVPDDHVTVLREWDRERSEAWAAGDPEALGLLYTSRSRAGREDVRRLEVWSGRGWTVHGVAPQLVDVLEEGGTQDELVLLVVDRLVGATAHRGEEQVRLPDGVQRTRRLTFRRDDAGPARWRMATVVEVPAGG